MFITCHTLGVALLFYPIVFGWEEMGGEGWGHIVHVLHIYHTKHVNYMDEFDKTSPMDQEYIDEILHIDYHQNMDYTDLILDESEHSKHIVPLYYIDHA
ncbi:hypothetical protein LTR95_001297 [Oleoguttula sp. CCFEE 5521]